MIKLGCYASMFGKDKPKTLASVESFIGLAYELQLDVIDFRADVGFQSRESAYLLGIKTLCMKYGLPIGYLASGGHFVGTKAELRQKVERIKTDVDMAVFLGAPMIRVFCGHSLEGIQPREIKVRIQVPVLKSPNPLQCWLW